MAWKPSRPKPSRDWPMTILIGSAVIYAGLAVGTVLSIVLYR